jgi:hypothetical protein
MGPMLWPSWLPTGAAWAMLPVGLWMLRHRCQCNAGRMWVAIQVARPLQRPPARRGKASGLAHAADAVGRSRWCVSSCLFGRCGSRRCQISLPRSTQATRLCVASATSELCPQRCSHVATGSGTSFMLCSGKRRSVGASSLRTAPRESGGRRAPTAPATDATLSRGAHGYGVASPIATP